MTNTKRKDLVFYFILYSFMIIVALITVYPFLNVLAISLNDSTDSIRGGIHIWPRQFTLRNYEQFLTNDSLVTGFKISILRTVIGTLVGVLSATMLAFTFSREEFVARRLFSLIFVVTMYVSGGLIPSYMLIRNLGLIDTFWVYIIPGLVSVFNVLVVRSFIEGLPFSLQESAQIDGAGDFTIFYKIILPLCTPVIATITLFIAVGQWSSWIDTFLYCSDNVNLTTLQYELAKILQGAQSASSSTNAGRGLGQNGTNALTMISPLSTKMAITIIATVPILMVYPFVQKYFVQGMTLGAVKS